jgi:hypothetical protein
MSRVTLEIIDAALPPIKPLTPLLHPPQLPKALKSASKIIGKKQIILQPFTVK